MQQPVPIVLETPQGTTKGHNMHTVTDYQTAISNKFSITSFDIFDTNGGLAIWDQVTETYSWLLRGELSEERLFSDEPGNDNEMTEQTRTAAAAWMFDQFAFPLYVQNGTVEFDTLAAVFGV